MRRCCTRRRARDLNRDRRLGARATAGIAWREDETRAWLRRRGETRAWLRRRRASRVMSAPASLDAPQRTCEVCPSHKRNSRPKKVLKRCYDALDADEWIGPISLDGRDTKPRYAHQVCALWCPEIYFDARSEKLKRCAEAFKRAKQIACSWCKNRGAAIGCGIEECPRSYHLICAHEAGCAFSQGDFMMACPRHIRRLAQERSDARWQDIGVEDPDSAGVNVGMNAHAGLDGSDDADGERRGGSRGGTSAAPLTTAAMAAQIAGLGATPILNRIRAAAVGRHNNKRKRGGATQAPLIDDKFMNNTREGAIYRVVMEAGARLNAEADAREGIVDDEEAFKVRESRRLDKDKTQIPRIVVGGGLGTSTYTQGWESLAGVEEHVKTLKELTLLPLAYPETFDSLGISAARGVLLHGPPGTGKTAAVRALLGAAAHGPRPISFFSRLGADCLGKYSGEAERKLRLLFEEAEKHQPSIIFFDEIDGLAPARRGSGASSSGAQDEIHSSVVATLLALMDGLSSRGSVVVVASTNRPDAVDSALRRPGRFDRELFFGLPDAAARADILAVHTRAWTPQPSRETLKTVAARTEGAAGADLRAIANAALMRAVKRACPSLLAGDPTRDSLSVELEVRLPPPDSAVALLDEARSAASLGHVGAGVSLKEFDALGVRLNVYWPLEDRHHLGTIVGYDRANLCHRIKYDDSSLLNAEESWLQLFRPNINVHVVEGDTDADGALRSPKERMRAQEAMQHAKDLHEKYLKTRRDSVVVEPRDWSFALTTSSGACSARSASAALIPRGASLPRYLVPALGQSLTRGLSEFVKRGAPMTPRCIQAFQSTKATKDRYEDLLARAGVTDGINADDIAAPSTPPLSTPADQLESAQTGCRMLLAGDVGNGQREMMDAMLSTFSGVSSHLINLPMLISHGDGDAVRGVSAALLEPLRQSTRTPTMLIMPDMDLWALDQCETSDGNITEISTSALWDLVQSTISESQVSSIGDGGLYMVATVNVPMDALPTSIKYFFESSGFVFDVTPHLKENKILAESLTRAAHDIVLSDVLPIFEESRCRVAATDQASNAIDTNAGAQQKASEESHELALEALRIRVRRSRSLVRRAVARCVKELVKTGRFDRFFEHSAQAANLIDAGVRCRIGDPYKFIKDLRACAKALKPQKNSRQHLHGPLASLGFHAVDTLESWLHLGVIKLYDEYAQQDKDYDVALLAANTRNTAARKAAKAKIYDATEDSAAVPATAAAAVAASATKATKKIALRRARDDMFAEAHSALHVALKTRDISNIDAFMRMVDDVRIAQRARERARVLAHSTSS